MGLILKFQSLPWQLSIVLVKASHVNIAAKHEQLPFLAQSSAVGVSGLYLDDGRQILNDFGLVVGGVVAVAQLPVWILIEMNHLRQSPRKSPDRRWKARVCVASRRRFAGRIFSAGTGRGRASSHFADARGQVGPSDFCRKKKSVRWSL